MRRWWCSKKIHNYDIDVCECQSSGEIEESNDRGKEYKRLKEEDVIPKEEVGV